MKKTPGNPRKRPLVIRLLKAILITAIVLFAIGHLAAWVVAWSLSGRAFDFDIMGRKFSVVCAGISVYPTSSVSLRDIVIESKGIGQIKVASASATWDIPTLLGSNVIRTVELKDATFLIDLAPLLEAQAPSSAPGKPGSGSAAPSVWKVQSLVLSGAGELRFGRADLKITELRISGSGDTSLDGVVFIHLRTKDGMSLDATVSQSLGMIVSSVKLDGADIATASTVIEDLRMGYFLATKGKLSAKWLGSIGPGGINGKAALHIADAAFSVPPFWDSRDNSLDISGDISGNKVLTVRNFLLAQPRTGAEISGTLAWSGVLTLDGKIRIPDAEGISTSWGLDQFGFGAKGSLEWSGRAELSFPKNSVVVKSDFGLTGRQLFLQPKMVPLVLKNLNIDALSSISYSVLTNDFDINIKSATVAADSILTTQIGLLPRGKSLSLSGSYAYRGYGQTVTFDIAREGMIAVSGSLSLDKKSDLSGLTAHLSSDDVRTVLPILWRPDLEEILSHFPGLNGPVDLTVKLTGGADGLSGEYAVLLPGCRLNFKPFDESYARAEAKGNLSKTTKMLTVAGTANIEALTNIGDVSASFAVSFGLANGDMNVAISNLNGPVTGGQLHLAMANGLKSAGASWSRLQLAPLIPIARKYKLIKETDFDLIGEVLDGGFDWSSQGVKVHGRLSDVSASFLGYVLKGGNGTLSAAAALDSTLGISCVLEGFSAAELTGEALGEVKGIESEQLHVKLNHDSSGYRFILSGKMSVADSHITAGQETTSSMLVMSGEAEVIVTPTMVSFGEKVAIDVSADSAASMGISATKVSLTLRRESAELVAIDIRAERATQGERVFLLPHYTGRLVASGDTMELQGKTDVGGAEFEAGGFRFVLPALNAEGTAAATLERGKYTGDVAFILPFANGSASGEMNPNSSAVSLKISLADIAAALDMVPEIKKMLEATLKGHLDFNGKLSQAAGIMSAEGGSTIALTEYSLDKLEVMGTSFDAVVSGQISVGKDAILFDVKADLKGGEMMVGSMYFDVLDRTTIEAKGEYSLADGTLTLASLILSAPGRCERFELSNTVIGPGGSVVRGSATFAGADIGKILDIFYIKQMAPGEKPRFTGKGLASGTVDFDISPDRANCVVRVSIEGFSCGVTPFRGGKPVLAEFSSTVNLLATVSRDAEGSLTFDAGLSSGKLLAGLSSILAEFDGLNLKMNGSSAGSDWSVGGKLTAAGSATIAGTRIDVDLLAANNFAIDLPFLVSSKDLADPPPVQAGKLTAKRLAMAGFEAKELELGLTLWNNVFATDRELKLEAGAGSINLGVLRIDSLTSPSRHGDSILELKDVGTSVIMEAMALTSFDGVITGKFGVNLSGSAFTFPGRADLKMFGGEVSITDFHFKAERYPEFGFAEMVITNIDLYELTKPFQSFAASVAGNLCGYVRNFRYSGGEPVSFDLWLHTEPYAGRKQLITAGIVNVIALNSEEVRTAMKFFNLETSAYKYIRIGASVRDGKLRISSAPDGKSVSEAESILLMGKKTSILGTRLILRVAGNVEGDWRAVWGSLAEGIGGMQAGNKLKVDM